MTGPVETTTITSATTPRETADFILIVRLLSPVRRGSQAWRLDHTAPAASGEAYGTLARRRRERLRGGLDGERGQRAVGERDEGRGGDRAASRGGGFAGPRPGRGRRGGARGAAAPGP